MFAKAVKSKGEKSEYWVIVDAQNQPIDKMRYFDKYDADVDCKRHNDEVTNRLNIKGYKE
ncbi:MAG: hypothetical protein ACKO96_04935 [Flammeovirgaceae bacterium]